MSKLFKLIIIFTMLGTTFGYTIFGQSAAQPRPSKLPIHWIDENRLVLLSEKAVYLRDLASGQSDQLLLKPPANGNNLFRYTTGSCFSAKRWEMKLKTHKGSSFSTQSVRLNDGEIVDVTNNLDRTGNTRETLDCFPTRWIFSGSLSLLKAPSGGVSEKADLRTLFHRSHFENSLSFISKGRIGIELQNGNSAKHIYLPSARVPEGREKYFLSSYDDRSEKYLLVDRTYGPQPFGKRDTFPGQVWEFNKNTLAVKSYPIPKPVWAREFPEKLRCFSAGCGSYQKVNLYYSQNFLYAHVWGRGYPVKIQGIYRIGLASTGANWKKFIKGPITHPLAFSAQFCRLAYATPKIKIVDIC